MTMRIPLNRPQVADVADADAMLWLGGAVKQPMKIDKIVYADYDDNARSISEISYKYRDDELSDYCFLSDDIRAFIDKWADFYF